MDLPVPHERQTGEDKLDGGTENKTDVGGGEQAAQFVTESYE